MFERVSDFKRPPDLRLCAGGPTGGSKALVILSDIQETLDAIQAFRKRTWTAVSGEPELVRPFVYEVVFTDRLDLALELSRRLHADPKVPLPEEGILTLLVENEHECLLAAYDAGADWVVQRPLNRDDPLCIHQMMDGG